MKPRGKGNGVHHYQRGPHDVVTMEQASGLDIVKSHEGHSTSQDGVNHIERTVRCLSLTDLEGRPPHREPMAVTPSKGWTVAYQDLAFWYYQFDKLTVTR